jgi:antitoxin (DNA-binding transcriptional repressor) of toxin-antitoxin stability system
MDTTITATELARNLSDILNRVRYKGESFKVVRGNDVVASIAPTPGRSPFTMADFAELLKGLPRPDAEFADDLEWAVKNQPPMSEPPPWPS